MGNEAGNAMSRLRLRGIMLIEALIHVQAAANLIQRGVGARSLVDGRESRTEGVNPGL